MKNIIIGILSLVILTTITSCKKTIIEPNYVTIDDDSDTLDYGNSYYGNQTDGYTNGGTLPFILPDSSVLAGSRWVLIKYVSAFASEQPNDTLYFVDDTHYTLNGGAERKYILADIPGMTNYDLTLYFFFPFSGSHYSAQISEMFMTDGELNNVEFEDIQNSSTTVRAWFIKI